MGLRLLILSWWTPKSIIYRELGHVNALTTDALETLITKYSSSNRGEILEQDVSSGGNVKQRRDAMSTKHANLVNSLVEALGKEDAIRLGREAMFKIGEKLGNETCQRLGVSKSLPDLIKAAKVLYRILGIEFEVEMQSPNTAILTVNRCALAANYSELTCQVLSATDEGTIRGLNKNMSMTFTERITGGQSRCKAIIRLRMNGGTNN